MGFVIGQRDVQRLGGRAATYPVSYIVYLLLREIDAEKVLDVTYGRGRFYYYKRPKLLVGADPKVWDWVVAPDIFIPRPVWALKPVLEAMKIEFDAIVVDPPLWDPNTHYNKRPEYSFILGTPELIIEKALELARELNIPYMLLHYNKTLGLPIIKDIEFRYVTRYLNNPDHKTTHFTLYKVI